MKSKRSTLLLLAAWFLGLVSFPAQSQEINTPLRVFYVDITRGDDSAEGSDQNPWRTLQRAANAVQAGDLVVVRPGRYTGFVLGWDFPQDGTAEHPISFRADPGVVIDTRNIRTPDGINLEGTSYIIIEGFEVVGLPRAGIRSVLNHNVTIRGNSAHQNNRWGIFTGFSDDLLIENNVATRSQTEHGIYVSNSSVRPVVRNNRIWGNRAAGIHMNGDVSQGGVGLITEALVEGNIIYDNGTGGASGINGDGVQDSIIRNNLLCNNHASGISLYRIDGAEGSKNNQVTDNTIIQAGDARWALNIKDESTGNTIRNNFLYNYHPRRGSISISADSLPNFTSDYNVVMERFTLDDGDTIINLAQWRTMTGQDLNSTVMTPEDQCADSESIND